MKRAVIAVGALTLVAGAVCYWQYTRSPVYSLLQARKALLEHDTASFQKYVDIEGVAERAIDQLMEVAGGSDRQLGDSAQQLGESFAKGLLSLLKPQLARAMKEQILQYVERGRFEDVTPGAGSPIEPAAEKSAVSVKNLYDRAGGEKSRYEGIDRVTKEGKIAYVGLRFFDGYHDSPFIVDIKMRDMGGYWQVAELSNLADVVRKLNDLERQRVERLNAPIRAEIDKSLEVVGAEKTTDSDEWGIAKKVIVTVSIRNCGQQGVKGFEANVAFAGSSGSRLGQFSVASDDMIPVGETHSVAWSKDVNSFDQADNTLFQTPQGLLHITVDVTSVTFMDGTQL